jgi:transcriptional regulator with XRE-family HTH domain
MAMMDPLASFPALIRRLRQSAGLSQHALARASRVDPAYVNRMESASPRRPVVPSPAVLERLARALGLDTAQSDELFYTAGRCPPSIQVLPTWEPVLGSLAERLADEALDQADRQELRAVLTALARRWHA